MEDLLGPELIARLDRLEVLSRKVFSGKLPGERRSKRRGTSVEFPSGVRSPSEKPYVPSFSTFTCRGLDLPSSG